MKFRFWIVLLMIFVRSGATPAQNLPSVTVTPPAVSLPKPLALTGDGRIADSSRYSLPPPPKKYADGTALKLTNDPDTMPIGPVMLNLIDPLTLKQIPDVNQADNHSNQYFWHPLKGWNYVHYQESDRQWYGWRTGDNFHWIQWRYGHFWWYDSYAERWLYFDRGYWWWQSLKNSSIFQVRLDDGHYHAVDANGVLGDDLMATGVEDDISATPNPPPYHRKQHDPVN